MSTQALDLSKLIAAEHPHPVLAEMYRPANIRVPGYADATLWMTGTPVDGVAPITTSLTDEMALVAHVAAMDIVDLPTYLVPMSAQFRHNNGLASLKWFGAMPGTKLKLSTAGDFQVDDNNGGKCRVKGGAGNMTFRRSAGVYCNVRPYNGLTVVRAMPMAPYSQDRTKHVVTADGNAHSETNTPAERFFYAAKHWLRLVKESGQLGLAMLKPTIADEDALFVAVTKRVLEFAPGFTIGKDYEADYLKEKAKDVATLEALLPEWFFDEVAEWSGHLEFHIADLGYTQILAAVIRKQKVIFLANDKDGDNGTDFNPSIPGLLGEFAEIVCGGYGARETGAEILSRFGYDTGNGFDATSVMYTTQGQRIYEQTLGSAGKMLTRLRSGNEGKPYNMIIHFLLIEQAYKDANPHNAKLHAWLDEMVASVQRLYAENAGKGFLEMYSILKDSITPFHLAAQAA